MNIYSTISYLYAEGEKDGKQRGLLEGTCRQICKLLLRHGKRTFGPPSEEQRAALETLAERLDLAQLEKFRDRAVTAASWPEVLVDIAPPHGELPAPPSYLLPYDFDPQPMPPSIDEYAKVQQKSGGGLVIHLRFQRLYQPNLGAILYQENKRLQAKYKIPSQAVVLLLWPGADGPGITGEYRTPEGEKFLYTLNRLWEMDAEGTFQSVATVVFAPLSRFDPAQLPEIIRRMGEVISSEEDPEAQGNLWSVVYTSMGLRYPAKQVNELLAPVLPMLLQRNEFRSTMSEGYYAGQSQGQMHGALQATRRWILLLGGQRLAEAPSSFREILESVQGLQRLEQIAARAYKASTWQDMLSLS